MHFRVLWLRVRYHNTGPSTTNAKLKIDMLSAGLQITPLKPVTLRELCIPLPLKVSKKIRVTFLIGTIIYSGGGVPQGDPAFFFGKTKPTMRPSRNDSPKNM